MPGWNGKQFATYGLISALAMVSAGYQVGCHKHTGPDDSTQSPILSYQAPTMLPVVGQAFASVAPDATDYVVVNGVGSTLTTGFTFTVTPPLPADLTLNPDLGVISGTPLAASASQVAPYPIYTITATTIGGPTSFPITLAVLASSPASLTFAGAGASSTAVGAAMALPAPTLLPSTVAAVGFGVSPTLPAGLTINPSSGVVSGTPTAPLAATVFTVTASTPVGSANAPFTLLVSAAVPAAPTGLAYATGSVDNPLVLTLNQPYTAGTAPAVTGTDLVYMVSPALPAGLVLDPLTGILSGTPTVRTVNNPYVVTASNAGGNSQTNPGLYLAVN